MLRRYVVVSSSQFVVKLQLPVVLRGGVTSLKVPEATPSQGHAAASCGTRSRDALKW